MATKPFQSTRDLPLPSPVIVALGKNPRNIADRNGLVFASASSAKSAAGIVKAQQVIITASGMGSITSDSLRAFVTGADLSDDAILVTTVNPWDSPVVKVSNGGTSIVLIGHTVRSVFQPV